MLTSDEKRLLNTYTNIGVVGGQGFVGSAVVNVINEHRTNDCKVIARQDNLYESLLDCDMVIHCANSPRRYEAEQDPQYDFRESIQKTFDIINLSKQVGSGFLLISSMSARTQLDTVYGRNRRTCEMISLSAGYPVIRLGYMYSSNKVYGALENILKNQDVYLSSQSEYSFSDLLWNAEKIVVCSQDQKPSIRELGSRGGITLQRIADILGSKSRFVSDKLDVQIANCDFDDQPNIEKFEQYLSSLKSLSNNQEGIY